MNDTNEGIRQSIRLFKNDLICRYYRLRINATQNPYAVFFKPNSYKILFILSHMRSGSSLLTHLLVSNPEIIGYGETHLQYSSESDFKNLMLRVYWQGQEFRKIQDLKNLSMHHKYILDKVLHDNKFLNDSFLQSENLYGIFLVREPKRTLVSMLDHKPHWNEQNALNYYIQRLSTLERYATLINNPKRCLFITHEQVIHQTGKVFKALQNVLTTKEGFSENYELLKTTGMRNVGDFKENIKAGHIVREERKLTIQISSDTLIQAQQSFDKCYNLLTKSCQTI